MTDRSDWFKLTEDTETGSATAPDESVEQTAPTREPVDHYATPGGIETIDFIKSLGWLEQFSLANCIKYVSRAGRKNNNSKLGDLRKARTYLDFVIQELEQGE